MQNDNPTEYIGREEVLYIAHELSECRFEPDKRNPCLSCVYDKSKDGCKARIFGLGDDCHEWRGLCAENAQEGSKDATLE